VVSFTRLPFYPRGKSPQCLLDRRLGGSYKQSRRREEEKNLTPNRNSNSDFSTVQSVAGRYADWAIPVPDRDNMFPWNVNNTSISLYGVTSQKTDLFTLTTVRTSDPTQKTSFAWGCISQDISSHVAHRANRHIDYWVQRKQALHRSISLKPQNSEHHYCIIWVIREFMGAQYLGQEWYIGTFSLWCT
jgi:hypothetical protein